jgi:hypothetical protein
VPPLAVLQHEVGGTRRGRAVLVGQPQGNFDEGPAAGAQPFHRLYVVDHGTVVREPLVLQEPLFPCEEALREAEPN